MLARSAWQKKTVVVLNLCKLICQLQLTRQLLQVATDLNSLATLSFHIGYGPDAFLASGGVFSLEWGV